MAEEPLSGRRRARHELPASRGSLMVSVLLGVVSVLLFVAWVAGSVAAGVIAFLITTRGSEFAQPGSAWQQPRLGADLVGWGCGYLAFTVGAQIGAVRYQRRYPRTRFWHPWPHYTYSQLLRHNRLVMVVLVALIVLGLWLRYS